MNLIRPFRDSDWPAVWAMLHATFAAGETYSLARDTGEADARKFWIDAPLATFVAEEDGRVAGTYFIKPNQPGLGDHVCNCGYIVAGEAQGRGIAARMCEHSQRWALDQGFRAMQFNFVVSTNERAVRLWERLGFSVVGRLPAAFRHPRIGFVDALVMYKSLSRKQEMG
jgi:ribosomal protein S18 acetylase RimI-like enzyme